MKSNVHSFLTFTTSRSNGVCHEGTYPISDEQNIQRLTGPEPSAPGDENNTLSVHAQTITQQSVADAGIAISAPSAPCHIPEATSRPWQFNPSPPYPENGNQMVEYYRNQNQSIKTDIVFSVRHFRSTYLRGGNERH